MYIQNDSQFIGKSGTSDVILKIVSPKNLAKMAHMTQNIAIFKKADFFA
jgi:hypothetical protein